jgi:SWI/SNF-related matrix-associated actin-dependent regulator of chromatin subfamily A3
MSVKRRQEALQMFGRPIEDETVLSATEGLSGRVRRSTRASAGISTVADDESSDFENNTADEDTDFLDDDDVLQRKKSSSKGKGKGKAKETYTAASTRQSGENPKVMLLSLKAGAQGLNLTVANNVFL